MRTITTYSPIAVVRLYEHALLGRIKLEDVLKTPNLQLQKQKYYLAGVTMFKGNHYCAVVSFGNEFWWYDGLVENFRVCLEILTLGSYLMQYTVLHKRVVSPKIDFNRTATRKEM